MSDGVTASAEHPVVRRLSRDMSLGDGARYGAKWIGGMRLVTQLLQFLSFLVSARLLLPGDFGQAAVAIAVGLFAQQLTDLGLAAAVVHVRTLTGEILSTVLLINVVSGLFLTGLTLAVSVPLARLLGNPDLAGLLAVVSLNFTVSCAVTQTGVLERTFNYRTLAVRETLAYSIGAVSVPVLALSGAGKWSLVIGPLISTTLLSILLWHAVPWRPTDRPSRSAAADTWRFSRGLIGFNLVNYWSRNLDTLLLAGRVSAGSLGEYTRAFNLTMIPLQQMNVVLGRVLFPSLTRMRDERERMGHAWVRAVVAAGTFTMPLTVTLAATAPALTYVLLGPRWTGMTPELELLALAATPQIIATATGGFFRASGHTGLLFQLSLYSTALSVLAIVAGLSWGTEGVATAICALSAVALPLVLVPVSRISGIALRRVTLDLARILPPALALGAGEMLVRWTLDQHFGPWPLLMLQLLVGVAFYVPALLVVDPVMVRRALQGVRGRLRR